MSETSGLLQQTHNAVSLNNFAITEAHKLTKAELFSQLQTSSRGLTSADAKIRRDRFGLNLVKPPVSCPSWLCCLLPCILSSHSMVLYNECVPDYAHVKRGGKNINMDSTSLVPGDVVFISKGDRVPADIRIIEMGESQFDGTPNCRFDVSAIMGDNMRDVHATIDCSSPQLMDSTNIAFLGYLCTQGDCFGVVIATGDDTLIAQHIVKKLWPPR